MEEILHRAEQLEKEYDWVGAAESYERVLNLLAEDDFSKMGEFHERLGYVFYRFAFQAESKDEFRERLRACLFLNSFAAISHAFLHNTFHQRGMQLNSATHKKGI